VTSSSTPSANRQPNGELTNLFELIIGTGLRKGEALALHWADVHLDQAVLFVRYTMSNISNTTPVIRLGQAEVFASRPHLGAEPMPHRRIGREFTRWPAAPRHREPPPRPVTTVADDWREREPEHLTDPGPAAGPSASHHHADVMEVVRRRRLLVFRKQDPLCSGVMPYTGASSGNAFTANSPLRAPARNAAISASVNINVLVCSCGTVLRRTLTSSS
jgi:integrase